MTAPDHRATATPGGIGRDLIRTYIRRNALVIVAHLLTAGRAFLLLPLLVKTFGAGVYGTYALLVGFTGFVFGISGLGSGYLFSRHAPSTHDLAWRRSLFCGALMFHLITVIAIAIVLLPLRPLLETVLLKSRFGFPIGPIVLLLISQTVFGHFTNYFRHTHRLRTYVVTTTAASYAFIAAIYLMERLRGSFGIDQIVLLHAASILVVAPIPIIFAARELWFSGPVLRRYRLRADLRLGLPVVAMFVVDYALSNSDQLLLAMFGTVDAVGAYRAAYVVGTAAIMIPKSLGVAVPALLARAEDSTGAGDVRGLMDVSARTVLLFTVPFAAGTLVYGWEVLALFTNEDVADQGYPAAVAAAAAVVLYGLFSVRGFLLYVKKRTPALLAATAAAAGFNLVLNAAILPFFPNVVVPSLTTLAAYALAYAIAVRATSNEHVPPIPTAFMLKVAGASFGIAAFRPILSASGSLGVLVACIVASGLLYLGLLMVFGAIPRQTLSVLRSPGASLSATPRPR